MNNFTITPSQSREFNFSSMFSRADYLLREKNALMIREMFPEDEPLEQCEPEQEDIILFIAKGCKIPEYLVDKPYTIIREGRLIKIT